jgi:RNA polymerase I-specific transcription initiation factor RRN3
MVSLAAAAPPGAMGPPPTPKAMPPRPTMGLKRDSSYLDTDDEVSTATKRLKVAFSPNVDIKILDESWNEKSFELVKEEVRVSIERHADLKHDVQYTKLVALLGQDAFDGDAPSGKLLRKYLLALEARVNSLGECGKLVIAVLDLAWLGRDEVFVGLYVRFLVSLASAQSKYIPAILERLVSQFAKLPASLGRLPGEESVSRAQMFVRLHMAVKTLLRQVPSASGVLTKSMKVDFPNDLATTRSYIQYQKQLLRLAEYATELTSEVLALIMQRLVGVDVQIQQDLEDLADESEDRLLQRPSSKDGDNELEDSDDSDSDSSSEETSTEDEQRLKELRLKVAKMDGTLDLLFEYYAPLIQDGSDPEYNEAYQQMLSHFTTFILPNRTRHAQFLLFHFAQTSEEHTGLFTRRCGELAFVNGMPAQRITAIAYLASFIARASHISSHSVRDVVCALSEYLDAIRKRAEPECRGPDRRSYAIYYAVAQALLYIFCFRWRDLVIGSANPELDGDDYDADDILAEHRDLAWLSGLKETFSRNIFSRLNPLKVCSPAIVAEFANIARHVRLVEVLSLLESNKRLRLGQTSGYYGTGGRHAIDIGRRETAWDRKTGEAHHQLEAYFPFDPYHLPKSKHWVEGDYNEWKLPRGMRQDDDEGYSDEDSDDESESDYDSDDSVAEMIEGNAAFVDSASTSS